MIAGLVVGLLIGATFSVFLWWPGSMLRAQLARAWALREPPFEAPAPKADYRTLPGEKRPCPRCGEPIYGNPAIVGMCAACHEVAFERKVREDKAHFRASGFSDQDEADRKLKESIERKLLAIPPSNEGRVILFDPDDDKEAS